jgi:hypothetical protein
MPAPLSFGVDGADTSIEATSAAAGAGAASLSVGELKIPFAKAMENPITSTASTAPPTTTFFITGDLPTLFDFFFITRDLFETRLGERESMPKLVGQLLVWPNGPWREPGHTLPVRLLLFAN